MSVHSMTGFGRASGAAGPERSAEVSARSVNSRFLDLTIKTRESDAALEPVLRRAFSRRLHRGKVEVTLRLKRHRPSETALVVDEALLDALVTRLDDLSKRYPIEGKLSVRDLMTIPQAIVVEAASETFTDEEIAAVEALAENAAKALVAMRAAEGAAIAADLAPRLQTLRRRAETLSARREEIARRHAETLRERVRALFPDVSVDPGRLEQEAALAADRSDVAEELQRLQGHLEQFEGIVARGDGSVGKTLDFLSQEILRELNTLGSKSRDLTSTREILEMKAETEKVREQVQNIE
ncbi:MAG TPA: YicC/YloC family endoribonuclease [Thermoanaerobaculia bacterium]|nr:YicC/YloC family endoribonuclease [Thermoanaerobaculia bacterium]